MNAAREAAKSSNRPYVAITADTHAGASIETYRDHLDPHSRENMRFAFSALPESEVRMFLGENAARLYGFDLEALRPVAERLGITPELVRQPLRGIPEDSTCLAFLRARAERALGKRDAKNEVE